MRSLFSRPSNRILSMAGWCFIGCLLLPFHGQAQSRDGLSLADLLTLGRTGLPEKLIEQEVGKLGLAFQTTPGTILALKEAGYSEDFLAGIVRRSGLSIDRPEPMETVRIFEELDSRGRRILVLTNLDDRGNKIVDPNAPIEEPPPRERRWDPPRPAQAPVESYIPPAPPTVVVNVEAPAPAPPAWGFQPVWAGSVIGSYEYPLGRGFLGYGPGTSSPGWFSGLGLNPSNNFGHRAVDKPNTQGLGAFFGPPSR